MVRVPSSPPDIICKGMGIEIKPGSTAEYARSEGAIEGYVLERLWCKGILNDIDSYKVCI